MKRGEITIGGARILKGLEGIKAGQIAAKGERFAEAAIEEHGLTPDEAYKVKQAAKRGIDAAKAILKRVRKGK